MTLNFWVFFWGGWAVTKSFAVEFHMLESRVVWHEHVNEKILKICLVKYVRFSFIRIRYFLDNILLKISVEDKHIIRFDSQQQQQDIFLQNVQACAWTYPTSYLMGTGVSFHGIKEAWAPPSGVKLKNEWSYTFAPLICLYGLDTHFTISEC